MNERLLGALQELATQDCLRLRVRGHSMAPVLPDGSTVEISRRKLYVPGDVIAFAAHNGSLRVHRLLGYRCNNSGWELITKGDNAAWIDPPFAADKVLGLVRGGPDYEVSLSQRLAAAGFFLRKSLAHVWRHLTKAS